MKQIILKRITRGFSYGIAGGIIISLIISAFSGHGDGVFVTQAFISAAGNAWLATAIQVLVFGLLGSVFHTSALIYECESLSLPAAAAIHYAIEAVLLFTCSWLCHWLPEYSDTYLLLIGMFTLGYLITFVVKYVFAKTAVFKFNSGANGAMAVFLELLPYSIVLAAVFWISPLVAVFITDPTSSGPLLSIGLGMLIYPFTIIVCGVGLGSKSGFMWMYPIISCIFFLPVLFIAFNASFTYILIIYAALSLLSNLAGTAYKKLMH